VDFLDRSWVLAKELEIYKLGRACNFNGCGRSPAKKVVLFESNIITHTRKELASLYFCSKHYNDNLDSVIKALSSGCGRSVRIEKAVKDMGAG